MPRLAFDAARAETILTLVAAGNWLPTAARAAGVQAKTVRHWAQMGRDDPEAHPDMAAFATALDRMAALFEAGQVANVEAAARHDARHAQWLLEKRFPARWKRPEVKQIQHAGHDGGPIAAKEAPIDLSKLSLEELRQLEDIQKKLDVGKGHVGKFLAPDLRETGDDSENAD